MFFVLFCCEWCDVIGGEFVCYVLDGELVVGKLEQVGYGFLGFFVFLCVVCVCEWIGVWVSVFVDQCFVVVFEFKIDVECLVLVFVGEGVSGFDFFGVVVFDFVEFGD